MFTGIVEEIGRVLRLSGGASGQRLTIGARKVLNGLQPGDSIAVNGVCLTVVDFNRESFTVEISPETLQKSNLGHLSRGGAVHLERALTLTSRLGGHFVQGHVDGTGKISGFKKSGETVVMKVQASSKLMRYIVLKGFVALDGVSLTVVDVDTYGFSVTLVPFTRKMTALAGQPVGYDVNIEVDILGKYVEKFLPQGRNTDSSITMEFLTQHGFKGAE